MQALPGFRDFLPEGCAKRNCIFARWREVSRRYAFVEWEGPVLEPTELYKKKSGSEIVDQLFNFTDKGDREVAMRPELSDSQRKISSSESATANSGPIFSARTMSRRNVGMNYCKSSINPGASRARKRPRS